MFWVFSRSLSQNSPEKSAEISGEMFYFYFFVGEKLRSVFGFKRKYFYFLGVIYLFFLRRINYFHVWKRLGRFFKIILLLLLSFFCICAKVWIFYCLFFPRGNKLWRFFFVHVRNWEITTNTFAKSPQTL